MLVRLNPTVDAQLAAALTDLWVRVVNTGGTVGFVAPVEHREVQPVANAAYTRAAAGLIDLAVAVDDGRPIGMGFLEPADPPLMSHLGTVTRLMRAPERPGEGIGAAVLAALEQSARRRGLDRVAVTVRGGRGTERWYEGRGFHIDGALPDRIRVRGISLPLLHMSKALDNGPTDPDTTSEDETSGEEASGEAAHRGTAGGMPAAGATLDGAALDGAAVDVGTHADPLARPAVALQVLPLDPDLPLPSYAHPGDAGLDLYAREAATIEPGARTRIATGIAVAVPTGHVGLVHPRSGLAARSGLGVLNAPGTIDAGYRGEVLVVLVNHDRATAVRIERGDRIAQLLVQRVEHVEVVAVDELPPTVRGAGGFGSSGR